MNVEELKKLLEDTDNKFEIFKDKSRLAQCDMTIAQLINIIDEYLSDEEKAGLFELSHFLKLSSSIKFMIIKSISDDNIKLGIITNNKIISEFKDNEIMNIINTLGDDGKIAILHMSDFIKEHNINDYNLNKFIKSLSEENKKKVLSDKDFIEDELHLQEYQIIDFIVSIEDEEAKLNIMKKYDFNVSAQSTIIKTFSDESKEKIILENTYEFMKNDLEDLISSFNIDSMVNFINSNKEFFEKNKINVYKITRKLHEEKQIEFISKLNDLDLNTVEKRKILATLSQDTKDKLDISNFPDEYLTAIQMQVYDIGSGITLLGKVKVDVSKDLEIYRGLDEIIAINPLNITNEDRSKVLELCDICPDMLITDDIGLGYSTTKEYKNSEKWIGNILEGMDPKWTDIQKLAFIDNKIGKKISYSPDYDTEVFGEDDARSLWKIIDSGYGVCNGVAQIEKYILGRVGIESEMVSGNKHVFLKIKDIDLPNAEGEFTKGDTVLDPTWNLTAHRYGAFPNNFCKSYTEIRKNDIRESDEKDLECHKNDEQLDSATLELDEQALRKVFASIGLTDRDGNFPIKKFIDKSIAIDDLKLPIEKEIEKQFLLLSEYYPEFAKCQNSTMSVLQNILLNHKNLNFDKCVVNRVYSRDDENKRPVLYVYINSQECGQKFYMPNESKKQFAEISPEEFISKFECYEMDMERNNGYRPWESAEITEVLEDLTKSSGSVVASECEER